MYDVAGGCDAAIFLASQNTTGAHYSLVEARVPHTGKARSLYVFSDSTDVLFVITLSRTSICRRSKEGCL